MPDPRRTPIDWRIDRELTVPGDLPPDFDPAIDTINGVRVQAGPDPHVIPDASGHDPVGALVVDGGIPGVIITCPDCNGTGYGYPQDIALPEYRRGSRCYTCSGMGTLHQHDPRWQASTPTPTPEAGQ